MNTRTLPRVVIVGAGFGGLTLARKLGRLPVDVLLIDRHNYHLFQPLLYQVATAGLEPEEIAHSVRGIFHGRRNFAFRLGTVESVDLDSRRVFLADGAEIPYDYLVLSAGVSTGYFGVEGAREHGFTLKSLDDALALRSHIIERFEKADRDPAFIDRGILTFVIVGGGATGVETAGALSELFHKVLGRDFPRLPMHRVRIVLVEATPSLLGMYHERLQEYAVRKLSRRGIEVRRGEQVVRVTPEAVRLKTGEVIPTETLIWAAGVQAGTLASTLGVEQARGGRIVVNDDLSLPDRPEVFVIGDMAAATDAEGKLLPQVAQPAIQGARHVARQIRNDLREMPRTTFRYRDPGNMATIGRNAAIAEFPIGLRASGFIAWVMWLVLHLVELIGFRNRLNVLVNWIWNYFTFDRSARLILGHKGREAEVTRNHKLALSEQDAEAEVGHHHVGS
ncbi:MAG TPA: NAD(P)/FAD-dependent oxidoreductase [Rhodothermales bacterium]